MSEIEEKVHSEIGASKADRWPHCPGSRRLCRGRAKTPEIWMAEGTVAHHVAESCLIENHNPVDFVGKVFKQDGFEIEVTDEMAEAVRVYVREIRMDVEESLGFLYVERKFHLKNIHPDLFGTCDAIVIDGLGGSMRVYDFKYGAFKPVWPDNNPQLNIYGLGALEELDQDKVISDIETVIIQPRAFHRSGPVRRWKTTRDYLYSCAPALKKAAEATTDPNAPLVPGDYCDWCEGKGICPALKKRVSEITTIDFDAPVVQEMPLVAALTPEQKSKIVEHKLQIEKFIDAVYQDVKAEIFVNPDAYPNLKPVESRATRSWVEDFSDRNGMLFRLLGKDVYDVKPKSVAGMEKALKEIAGLKKSDIATILEGLVNTSRGIQIVPEYDKRPRFVRGDDMFPEEEDVVYEL